PTEVMHLLYEFRELKKTEAEKEKLEARLQQAHKMEAIGTLAGGIAHDFINILGVIIGYTEMAIEDSPPESSAAEDLDKVLKASYRAKSLVKQILAFSRQNETDLIPLQPATIVKEAIKMLRPSLPSTIEINQNIDTKAGLIFADPTQIHQIIMNLCTNAFHAMEKAGGTLDISLKETVLSPEDLVHEPHVKAGIFVQLSICDSGPGIAPDIKDKIFDPYFTTKDIVKGTGMGLAIAHGIVKSYGGFISLYSELGEGTVFHVFIPTVKNEILPKTEAVEKVQIGKENVLLVDDEEILTEIGKDMLERLGYNVTVRNSSMEALETFQNQPKLFDIVITDQTMPGMTGADLARRMLQIRPDIPIILCTGYSTIITEEKAKAIGIKEFALKPLAKKDIGTLIRKVLDAL
nr:response regulator [Bacteroidales bacterium]